MTCVPDAFSAGVLPSSASTSNTNRITNSGPVHASHFALLFMSGLSTGDGRYAQSRRAEADPVRPSASYLIRGNPHIAGRAGSTVRADLLGGTTCPSSPTYPD